MGSKRYLRIISVFNEDFEGDVDLTGDMKFENFLCASEEYAELSGVGGDPGGDTSFVAQSEFSSKLHPEKRIIWNFSINFFSRVSLSS